MRQLYSFLMLLFFHGGLALFAASNARIVGNVTCEGRQIQQIMVQVNNTSIGTETDFSGKFQLADVPVGKQVVRAYMIGYKPQEKVVEVKLRETQEVNFELEEDHIGLSEVVVTADRNERSRQDASVIVNVLSAKTFQAVNAVCLSEGLNYQPGLRVENNCQNCGFQQIRINGLEGPYSQILIDSRPIYSALSGVYGIEQIPVNMVERVEVVRGGGSALYGSNAIAGTINIITKEPLGNSFDVSENISLIGGHATDNTIGLNGSFVTEDHKAGLNMFSTHRAREPYDANGDGFSELGKINGDAIGFRSYYKPTQNSKWTATYHYLNEFRRGGNKFDLQPHETDITEQTEHNINGGELAYDLFTTNQSSRFTTYLSAQQTNRKSYYGAQQNTDAYGKTDDFAGVGGIQYFHVFDRLLFAKANLITGAEYQINNMHDQMPGYNRDLKQDIQVGGFFLQNEWETSSMHLLLGGRVDKHNLIEKAIVSPRANLLIDLTPKLQWRMTYSTGFRAPQAFDEDLHILAVGGEVMLIQLAENLTTERSTSMSSSLDCYHDLFGLENNFMLEGFYTRLSDVFVVEEIGTDADGNKLMERRNGSGADVYGINMENRMVLNNKYQVQFGFTVQQSRYQNPETWSDDAEAELLTKLPRSPETYGYLSLTANPLKNLKAYLSGTYTGSMLVPHYAGYIEKDVLEKSPSFLDVNLKFAYDFKMTKGATVRLETGVQNILNSYQADFDKGEYRDAGYVYGPMKPRSFFLGIKIGNLL
jgi:outer membrane receptor for ferrienterochelin and colicins